MTVTHEDLMAFADGELHGADKARVVAALAAEPDLQVVIDNHRALASRLSAAYAPVLDEPVPARLTQAAQTQPSADNVVSLGAVRAMRTPGQWSVREWSAMAAALLVGVIVGGQALRPDNAIDASNGALEARGALARALDTQLAADKGAVRIGVTFRTSSGDTCRTFAADGGALLGLACSDGGEWHVDMAMTSDGLPSTEFRMANVEIPRAILSRIEGMIQGEPLDAEQEKAARDRHWVSQTATDLTRR